MADQPVNLRRWRKRKARDAKRAEGDANAARHGAPKHETTLTRLEAARRERELDGKRLDDDD